MPNPLTKAGEEEARGFFPFTEVFPIEGVIFIEGKYSVGFFCRPRGGGGDTCSLSGPVYSEGLFPLLRRLC